MRSVDRGKGLIPRPRQNGRESVDRYVCSRDGQPKLIKTCDDIACDLEPSSLSYVYRLISILGCLPMGDVVVASSLLSRLVLVNFFFLFSLASPPVSSGSSVVANMNCAEQ